MADTANVQWQYSVSKDSVQDQRQHSFSYTPASSFKGQFRQNILTTLTAITFPNATTLKSFAVINPDAANFLELYTDATGTTPFAKILASTSCPPITVKAGVPYYAKADTAAIKADFMYDAAS